MNLPCEIIQDLLLLYTDDACSPDSRTAVEEHLSQCSACRQYMETLGLPKAMVESVPEPVVQERVMKNSFRKLRRRWLLSVLSVLLLFPMLLLGIMGVHEYRGEGLAFTNLDEMFQARRLMRLIEDQRFEEAAGMLDFEGKYQEIREILKWEPEDYLPSVILCTVDGETWAVRPYLEEQYHIQWLCEDSVQLWSNILFNRIQGALIPEAVWQWMNRTAKEEMEANDVYESYFLIDTPWGRFYTDQSELAEEPELTAEKLVQCADFFPYEIYLAAQEGLWQTTQEAYQANQEYYAFAADMTREEYVQVMRDRFVQAMEACCSNGVTLQSPRFAGAWRIGQSWEIEISAAYQNAAGTSLRVKYAFMVQNGGLRIVGSSRPMGLDEDPVAAALRMSCP